MHLSRLLPYAAVRPLLFCLDPERAHDLTLDLIAKAQNTPLRLGWAQPFVGDPVSLAGLNFPNRVGMAAGLDKNARCLDGLAAMGFGFIEVGTVTPLAQSGNPKPRMFRLPEQQALINRLGFNNAGLEAFVAHVKRSQIYSSKVNKHAGYLHKSTKNLPLIGLNIGKNAATPIEQATDDYLIGLSGVYPHADYITINISSPNTQNLRNLQSDAALDALLSAVAERRAELIQKHSVMRPIFLKIAPDLDAAQISVIASTVTRHGIDGIIATNTTLARDAVRESMHAKEAGGLSGRPVFAMSNQVIAQLRQALGPRFPIIGVGGVMSGQDALEKISAGADAVQIYTGLIYKGPGLVHEIAATLNRARSSKPNQL